MRGIIRVLDYKKKPIIELLVRERAYPDEIGNELAKICNVKMIPPPDNPIGSTLPKPAAWEVRGHDGLARVVLTALKGGIMQAPSGMNYADIKIHYSADYYYEITGEVNQTPCIKCIDLHNYEVIEGPANMFRKEVRAYTAKRNRAAL